MIRRGFWLGAGAILGITGYRRVARLVRTLTGQDRLVLTRQDTPALGRDVPAMARAKARSAIAGAAAAAGFVRDVRAGMSEYRDLHGGEADRSLGSQSARALPGQSQQGRREA